MFTLVLGAVFYICIQIQEPNIDPDSHELSWDQKIMCMGPYTDFDAYDAGDQQL